MRTIIEKVLFLKSVALFSHIPGGSLAKVAEIAREADFAAGDVIIRQGETGDSLYIILEGRVRVTAGGREVARLCEKECFGEMALLDSEPISATVTAETDVSLLTIGQEDFYELSAERAEISQGIITLLSRRLRNADKHIEDRK